MNARIIAVSLSSDHTFSKTNQQSIRLLEGIGVQGDAHAGKQVKHRYLANKDATRPNIRQVHLMQAELFDELNANGFSVEAGQLGENLTTRGVDLLALPNGTRLQIGAEALVELTALRNPCVQIDRFQKGLLKAVLIKDQDNNPIRRAGVMGIVLNSGNVQPGDEVQILLPPEPRQPLEYVW